MVLYDELMAENWRVLAAFWTPHFLKILLLGFKNVLMWLPVSPTGNDVKTDACVPPTSHQTSMHRLVNFFNRGSSYIQTVRIDFAYSNIYPNTVGSG